MSVSVGEQHRYHGTINRRNSYNAPPRSGRRRRLVLSLFFALHWGAVVTYVLPETRESLEPVPAALRPLATFVFPRLVQNTWWLTNPYLNLTGTRQHWGMFAPFPAEWTGTVKVVPYFRVATPDGSDAWLGDTLVVHGARDVDFPHFLHHRTYRILYNLGDDGWGNSYRPVFAREMCRTLRDQEGQAPEGISLLLAWIQIVPSWEDRNVTEQLQWMGGYPCSEESVAVARRPWGVYRLPEPVSTEGWPVAVPDGTGEPGGVPSPGDVRGGPAK